MSLHHWPCRGQDRGNLQVGHFSGSLGLFVLKMYWNSNIFQLLLLHPIRRVLYAPWHLQLTQGYELSLLVPMFPLYTPPILSVRPSVTKTSYHPIQFHFAQFHNFRTFSVQPAPLTKQLCSLDSSRALLCAGMFISFWALTEARTFDGVRFTTIPSLRTAQFYVTTLSRSTTHRLDSDLLVIGSVGSGE